MADVLTLYVAGTAVLMALLASVMALQSAVRLVRPQVTGARRRRGRRGGRA